MKGVKRAAGSELEVKFDAAVISEYDLEKWVKKMFRELYENLSKSQETGEYNPTKLKFLIMTEVEKKLGNLLSDIEGRGSKVVVLVKEKTSEGYFCDIITPSYFYISVVNMLDEFLSEKLFGESI
jgi:hypothetical protein